MKTREAIRYLDRKTKAQVMKTINDTIAGSLRIQASDEMFSDWEECEKLHGKFKGENLSNDEIPRHFRGMVNCALFQRSKGNEVIIVSDDVALGLFTSSWNLRNMTVTEMESTSFEAVQKYKRDIGVWENRKRNSQRSSAPTGPTLWAPQK